VVNDTTIRTKSTMTATTTIDFIVNVTTTIEPDEKVAY
jgi:hypothetical protein